MLIREFKITDYKTAHELWLKTEGVCNCDECMRLDSEVRVEKYLKRNPNSCFIAEEDGKLIGTILAGHDGRTGWIYRLSVSDKHRKKGIGKSLVNHAVEALKKEEITVVKAFVLKENVNGNNFWENIKFTESDTAVTRVFKIAGVQNEKT
jgi:ribosomal protein S18 acetylase RimI-like enzyme